MFCLGYVASIRRRTSRGRGVRERHCTIFPFPSPLNVPFVPWSPYSLFYHNAKEDKAWRTSKRILYTVAYTRVGLYSLQRRARLSPSVTNAYRIGMHLGFIFWLEYPQLSNIKLAIWHLTIGKYSNKVYWELQTCLTIICRPRHFNVFVQTFHATAVYMYKTRIVFMLTTC